VIWQASTNLRLNRTVRAYRRLARGAEGQPLVQILERMVERGEVDAHRMDELERGLTYLADSVEGHLQRVGMVRYNAYDDTGGDQSFALALLDARGNGALFNGLFHRTECRVYAKPIRDWKSTYSLSDEEEEAIRKARAGSKADGPA
jgi:hypothetical protein